MNEMTRITVDIDSDDAARLQQAVDAGTYASIGDAVRDVIGGWMPVSAWDTKRLRAAIQAGIDSGPAEPFDVDQFLTGAKARRAARNA